MATLQEEERPLIRNNGLPQVWQREPEPEAVTEWGWRPEAGDRKTWVPAAFQQEHTQGVQSIRPVEDPSVTGTVVYVHPEHRWYRVRFRLPDGTPAYECFKF